jgi:hypothetical protein
MAITAEYRLPSIDVGYVSATRYGNAYAGADTDWHCYEFADQWSDLANFILDVSKQPNLVVARSIESTVTFELCDNHRVGLPIQWSRIGL